MVLFSLGHENLPAQVAFANQWQVGSRGKNILGTYPDFDQGDSGKRKEYYTEEPLNLLFLNQNLCSDLCPNESLQGRIGINSQRRFFVSQVITVFLFFGTATWISYRYDQQIQRLAQSQQSRTLEVMSNIGRWSGDGGMLAAFIASVYAYAYLNDDYRARQAATNMAWSLLISTVITDSLKVLTHRSRPRSGLPPDSWHGPGLHLRQLSFPSGHASAAFSVATAMALVYADNTAIVIGSLSLASLAAYSRVHDNKHWASDVLMGSGIGVFSALLVYNYQWHKKIQRKTGLSFSAGASGIALCKHF